MHMNASPTQSSSGPAFLVDGRSVSEAYVRRYELNSNARIFLVKRDGVYQGITWKESHARVLAVHEALKKAGVKTGDRVALMSQTRPEWFQIDQAILAAGAVTVPVYHSSAPDDVEFILNHCGAKLVFAEDEAQTKKLAEIYQGKPAPSIVVIEDKTPKAEGLSFKFLNECAKPLVDKAFTAAHDAFKKSAQSVPSDAMASIVYTSGTTGRPKGAILRHSNFTSELRAICRDAHVTQNDVTLTFLPFAHIMGRVESLITIFAGTTLGFAENVNSVAQNIGELKPTLLVSVPRIYEKIYAKINSDVEGGSDVKKKIFKWALGVGREVARRRSEKQSLPLLLQAQFRLADQLVFSKVRNKMGGQIRVTLSGGAPLNRELAEFFHACGVKVMEAYGLTETTAAITFNRPDDFCFGSVGKSVAETEFRIAADGEILARGPAIFFGYYDNEEATKESLSADGWFSTGDIGEFNERGFLRITDRKKELIVTSGGKNVAPQKLENLLKATRFVSQALVIGDKRKYLSALITLNEPEVKKWAESKGIAFSKFEDLVDNKELQTLVEADVKNINADLASFESIKKIKLLPKDFTVETGELTPSLKIKRKVISAKYQNEIEGLYR